MGIGYHGPGISVACGPKVVLREFQIPLWYASATPQAWTEGHVMRSQAVLKRWEQTCAKCGLY